MDFFDDFFDDVPEKTFFGFSIAPPMLLTLLVMRLMMLDPEPLLNSIKFIVPGYIGHKFFKDTGVLRLRLDGSADFWTQQLTKIQQQFQTGGVMRPSPSRASNGDDETPAALEDKGMGRQESDADDLLRAGTNMSLVGGDKKYFEFWLQLQHLVRSSCIPVLFLSTYFWNEAILHREASIDFPLDNCMDADDTKCFYIEQTYSILKYPDYTKLKCESMWDKTVNASYPFSFKAPRDAKFYKCYQRRYGVADILAALGDVAFLLTLSGLFILRYSISVTDRRLDGEGKKSQLQNIKTERRWSWFKIIVCAVLAVLGALCVPFLYGSYTNDFAVYLGVPGMMAWYISLLWSRLEVLEAQRKTLNEDDDDDSEDERSVAFSEELEGSSSGDASSPSSSRALRMAPRPRYIAQQKSGGYLPV